MGVPNWLGHATILGVMTAVAGSRALAHDCFDKNKPAIGLGEDPDALETHATPTAPRTARLRKRSRWVNAVQAAFSLEGRTVAGLLTGRWTPDLPCAARSAEAAFLTSLFRFGGRVLGGGSFGLTGEGENTSATYLHVQLPNGDVHCVSPELTAKLSNLACYRKRDAGCLAILRHRALRWAKDQGLRDVDLSLILHGSIGLGMMIPEQETQMGSFLRSNGLAGSMQEL